MSPEQKAQVAELLGANWLCLKCGFFGTLVRHEASECHYEPAPKVTLEALLAYCREQGWGYSLRWDGEAVNALVGYHMRAEFFRDPDPLEALSLAVLTAHQQETTTNE